MAIIINEFEIVPEPAQPQAAIQTIAPPASQTRLRPDEVEQIVARQRLRFRRIWAD